MVYWQLFWGFFQIGALSFGGGYAVMPLISAQAVDAYGWMTMETFADVVTIAGMMPGSIAINAATFVGVQVAGIPGAIIATFACVLPACTLLAVLAWAYKKFRDATVMRGTLGALRPAVVAMIASAGIAIMRNAAMRGAQVDFAMVAVIVGSFFILRKWKPSPIYLMLGAGVIGAVLHFVGV